MYTHDTLQTKSFRLKYDIWNMYGRWLIFFQKVTQSDSKTETTVFKESATKTEKNIDSKNNKDA